MYLWNLMGFLRSGVNFVEFIFLYLFIFEGSRDLYSGSLFLLRDYRFHVGVILYRLINLGILFGF